MKTKIIEVGEQKYQIRKLSPAAGSFIYFKMMGAMMSRSDAPSKGEHTKAVAAAEKMSAEEKARALCISTFMQGLDYESVEFAQRHAMMVTSRIIYTGGVEAIIPVMTDDGRWLPAAPGEVDLADEPALTQQISMEVLVFSLSTFFVDGLPKR